MKIGLVPINVGVDRPEALVGLAQKAEEVGLESVWTFEHVIVPVDYQSKYPYSADGKMGVDPDANFVDPLIALTAIAAQTKTMATALSPFDITPSAASSSLITPLASPIRSCRAGKTTLPQPLQRPASSATTSWACFFVPTKRTEPPLAVRSRTKSEASLKSLRVFCRSIM